MPYSEHRENIIKIQNTILEKRYIAPITISNILEDTYSRIENKEIVPIYPNAPYRPHSESLVDVLVFLLSYSDRQIAIDVINLTQ